MPNMSNFGFFNFVSGDDDTYRYTAEEFSTILSAIAGNGVNYKYGDKLACTNSGTTVTIASGGVWVNGHYGYNTASSTLTLTDSASLRKDYICAHLDSVNRVVEIIQVQGTGSDYPTVDSNYVILYKADVNSGSVSLTDVRSYNYGSSNMPSQLIIVSDTEPTPVLGAIWLKPVTA